MIKMILSMTGLKKNKKMTIHNNIFKKVNK